MTDSQGERGLWAAAGEPGNSAMCGARYEAGHLVRRDRMRAAGSVSPAAGSRARRASWTSSTAGEAVPRVCRPRPVPSTPGTRIITTDY
jgi:hypothetical protein